MASFKIYLDEYVRAIILSEMLIILKELKFLYFFSIVQIFNFEHLRYHFKATGFDRAIVEKQGMYGVKQMPQTHTTAARPFHFQSDSRMNLRKHKLDDSGNEV